MIASLVWQSPLTIRFRGLDARDGVLLRGEVGWGECSPFWEYDDVESVPWWRSALETAQQGWPTPVRAMVPVNVTVPAVGPEVADRIVRAGGGCRTAKVKVAQRLRDGSLEALDVELDRVAAVRAALDDLFGPGIGRIRVDANGAWSPDDAVVHLREIDAAAGGLEYAEQPCASVEDLARLRRRIDVPIAADESIRRAEDPMCVVKKGAADVVVLKVQPLGGVRACLELAERVRLPVVVSSALESSIGLAAGVALAAALPELPYACGLATSQLLISDVVSSPLLPIDGQLPALAVDDSRLVPDPQLPALTSLSPNLTIAWERRMARLAITEANLPFRVTT